MPADRIPLAETAVPLRSGVDPVLVGERIQALKGERQQSETALAQLDLLQRERIGLDLDEACAVLDSFPDLSKPLAKADPELRRSVHEAFQFGIEPNRDKPEIRLKALVSSAFSTTSDLDDLAGMVANGVIAEAGFEPATFGLLSPLVKQVRAPPRRGNRTAAA